MGILADFFVATTEDALLYEQLLFDEKPIPEDRYVCVTSGGLTGLELGLLWAILEGVPWNVDRHLLDFQLPDNADDHIDDDDESEVSSWTEKFPTAFVRQLSLISDGSIASIGAKWSECEELASAESDQLVNVVVELRQLAQTAIETERDLFLWGSL